MKPFHTNFFLIIFLTCQLATASTPQCKDSEQFIRLMDKISELTDSQKNRQEQDAAKIKALLEQTEQQKKVLDFLLTQHLKQENHRQALVQQQLRLQEQQKQQQLAEIKQIEEWNAQPTWKRAVITGKDIAIQLATIYVTRILLPDIVNRTAPNINAELFRHIDKGLASQGFNKLPGEMLGYTSKDQRMLEKWIKQHPDLKGHTLQDLLETDRTLQQMQTLSELLRKAKAFEDGAAHSASTAEEVPDTTMTNATATA